MVLPTTNKENDMPLYRTSGVLTGTIERENVPAAQAYLTQDNMTKYLDPPLEGLIEHVEWNLDGDGHHWSVTAFAIAELTNKQLKKLSDFVSGQNSDGLGEGFEQQDFAEEDGDCGDCYDCEHGYSCEEYGGMISFDWKKNKCAFVRVV